MFCHKLIKVRAKKIFDGYEFMPEKSVLIFDKAEKLIDVLYDQTNLEDVFLIDGILTPGFVNVHCHTELSHLENIIPKQTGLLQFLMYVITKRHLSNDTDKEIHIQKTFQNFEAEGVVAIGDICNTADSILAKQNSSIYCHNFIEAIGFDEHLDNAKYDSFILTLNKFKALLPKQNSSMSPHAPYSLSPVMMQRLSLDIQGKICTIHNQECEAENIFYKEKKGDFINFYKQINVLIDFFVPTNKSSVQSIFKYLQSAANVIFVHNVFIEKQDIVFLQKQKANIFFAICCNANLYIQNKLPPLQLLLDANATLVIGTDSFASNKNLSMLEEIKTIQKHFSNIGLEKILKWATYNGAKALDIDKEKGSFEIGKVPGLVQIKNYETHGEYVMLNDNSVAKKILLKNL